MLLRAAALPNFSHSLFAFPRKALAIGTIANSTFLGSDWLMFLKWENSNLHFGSWDNSELPLNHMLLIPQSWSIGIEITFYLLAPMLCKAKSSTISILGIALLVGRFLGIFLGLKQAPWAYPFFIFELLMFLIGILIYRSQINRRDSFKIGLNIVYPFLISVYVSFPDLIAKLNFNRFWQIVIPIVITCIIIMFGIENVWDKKFGELSYPFYICHILVITSFSGVIHTLSIEKLNNPLLAILIALFLTILFSFLLIQLVKPTEKIRDKNRK